MKLEEITLGHSPLTDSIYAGRLNKAGDKWLDKKDVTNEFIDCVIKRWEGHTENISQGDKKWEITVKRIK